MKTETNPRKCNFNSLIGLKISKTVWFEFKVFVVGRFQWFRFKWLCSLVQFNLSFNFFKQFEFDTLTKEAEPTRPPIGCDEKSYAYRQQSHFLCLPSQFPLSNTCIMGGNCMRTSPKGFAKVSKYISHDITPGPLQSHSSSTSTHALTWQHYI